LPILIGQKSPEFKGEVKYCPKCGDVKGIFFTARLLRIGTG